MPNTNVMHIDTLLVALILVWYLFFGEFLEKSDLEKWIYYGLFYFWPSMAFIVLPNSEYHYKHLQHVVS